MQSRRFITESLGAHASAGVAACMDAGVVVGPWWRRTTAPRLEQRIPRGPPPCLRIAAFSRLVARGSTSLLIQACPSILCAVPVFKVYQPLFSTFPAFGSPCTVLLCIVAVPSFGYIPPSHARTHDIVVDSVTPHY
jgi:hypothetical protein